MNYYRKLYKGASFSPLYIVYDSCSDVETFFLCGKYIVKDCKEIVYALHIPHWLVGSNQPCFMIMLIRTLHARPFRSQTNWAMKHCLTYRTPRPELSPTGYHLSNTSTTSVIKKIFLNSQGAKRPKLCLK